jgi:hypothetical protein
MNEEQAAETEFARMSDNMGRISKNIVINS